MPHPRRLFPPIRCDYCSSPVLFLIGHVRVCRRATCMLEAFQVLPAGHPPVAPVPLPTCRRVSR